jgi:hypothetical protein
MMLEEGNVSIGPKYAKVITSRRTAVENGRVLDRVKGCDDVFDAFRLALRSYSYKAVRIPHEKPKR